MRNPEREVHYFRLRVLVAVAFVITCFTLLGARFAWLQVVKHEAYLAQAELNRIAVLPVAPNRGLIKDRHGRIIARNYSAYTLEITPTKVANLEQTIDQLAQVVEVQPRDRRRFKKLMEDTKRFDSVPIRTRLTDEEVARFTAQRYRFPGVELRARLFRDYPLGLTGSHMLGYIGRISQRDLERIEKLDDPAAYAGTEHIGKLGIEQSYEGDLHGTTGVEEVEITAGGRAVRTLKRTPSMPGNNLTLSVDIELQRVVEQAFGDRRGALIAIEPKSGDVLAFVSMPNFDPNLFVDGIDPKNWDELNNDPDKPLLNRALRGTYPIGSTYKPFLALAALETGKRRTDTVIHDGGTFVFGNRVFRDSNKVPLGAVDMHRSIVKSSDIYYYQLANDLGVDTIHDFMKPWGFGQITGIDVEGEQTGILPSTAWKERRFKQKWYPGETISIGIGQGYNSFTLLQLAHATANLANDGVVMKPHLVKEVEDARTGEQATDRAEGELPYPGQARAHEVRARRDGRRQHQRHRSRRLPGRAVQGRRQDRHGAGRQHQAGREVQRGESGGTPSRPFALHRVRAGRGSEDRDCGAGGKRRVRRPCRGADCAGRDRLLPARQEAGRTGGHRRRTRRRGSPAHGRGGGPHSGTERAVNEATLGRRVGLLVRPYVAVFDPSLLAIVGCLGVIGLITLYSAGNDFPWRVTDQMRNFGVALAVMFVAANISPQVLMRLAVPIYLVGVGLLVATEVTGITVKGATRWLDIGVGRIQPSEIMKLGLPMMLAWYFHKREGGLRSYDFVIAAVIVLVPVALIIKQPDLGTALLVLAAGSYVIFFAGLPWKWLLAMIVAGIAALPLAWTLMHDYQRERILTLIDPSTDPLGKGFHTLQAMIAIGSGGVFGKGWMQGTQTHLEFIPERTSDFIFAVYSEEFGMVGNLVLVLLFFALIWRAMAIALNAPTLFARLLAAALGLIIFTYAFVNMGMVSGILPVVGVPLPFISYGGTALVTLGMACGMLMSIGANRKLVQS